MGFSGGGSNVLKPHKHSSAVQDGSSLDMNNVTEGGLTAGDIVYSDGSALQRLPIGSTTDSLVVSGGIPSWGAATSNPLIKVTKTFADIVVAGTYMEIYTLPVNAALTNVYTDITTVFDLSTAVTVGDGSDNNGFIDSANFTAGLGLTAASRGAYITTWKTMRSVSGTTAIRAYNFTTAGGTGTTFEQLLTNRADTMSAAGQQEYAQQFNAGHVLVGENIANASFWLNVNSGTPTGDITCYIRQADGTLIETSSTTLDPSTVTGSYVEYHFDFPNTALAATDMITLACTNVVGGVIAIQGQETEMTNGKLYNTTTTGSGYSQVIARELKMTVEYDVSAVTTDTQGEVDFYLQVVD